MGVLLQRRILERDVDVMKGIEIDEFVVVDGAHLEFFVVGLN
jgi:hypothetical protein